MSIRWHKYDVLFHLKGGQSVKAPAYSLSITKKANNELASYTIKWPWRHSREAFYVRLDSVDSIELRNRGWWRWAW